MSSITQSEKSLNSMDRYRFLMVLNAANICQEYQFVKEVAMLWLANYPGDLFVKYHQALSYAKLDLQNQAFDQLEQIVTWDPTFLEAVRDLQRLSPTKSQQKLYADLVCYLEEKAAPDNKAEKWLAPLWSARIAFSQGEFDLALVHIHEAMVHNPPTALPAILHLKTARELGNQDMLSNLSEIYHQQWPNCLHINVIRALVEMDLGLEATAVERLHWVAAHDTAGQVIEQLMGVDHPFKDLWPDRFEICFDLPIPASVSAYLGWNRLNAGQVKKPTFAKNFVSQPRSPQVSSSDVTQKIQTAFAPPPVIKSVQAVIPEDVPLRSTPEKWASEEDLEEIRGAFSKIAKRLKKPELERADNRFPVYVVMTSKGQLEKFYGPNTAMVIDGLLNELVSLIQNLPDWGASLFYPDDPEQLAPMGIKPVIGNDPWQIKLALADLDQALAKRGEMIGALLIVGGPEIVPFHNLPNPTFDDDMDVPSDNPYACIDENYFVAQWPVGRLPGEAGPDAGLLLEQIRNLTHQYQKRSKNSKTLMLNITTFINWFLQIFNNLGSSLNQNKSQLGYSAEIWHRASTEVYKTIGDSKNLQLSPPNHANSIHLNGDHGLKLGYFNLHGIKDGPDWYGQKDFSSFSNGPDYPVALTPTMFDENNSAPKLVLTEACYGAHIIDKQCEEAISLKCLDTGTQTFVGSTCISYGSVTPPLIAADLLANTFWKKIAEGLPAGYALMQAKLLLAEEMIRLQGFLDGEDQKTLLSFVLYGDPLAQHDGLQTMPKALFRFKSYPALKTISDYDMLSSSDEKDMPKQVNKQVKKVVEKYLPGLENAQMSYKKSKGFAGSKIGSETNTDQSGAPERYVVTLKKSFEENQHTAHHHFARMTFDKKGKLVKFTTSR
ncbi:MAG TPA: C25 family cysteine peptidase [Brevefilum fermentans]|nr:C25 family cysteine peptidase [Chloroflexota bacterium]HQA28786.1 C25 family cysteine peptidase [Brevefilum fermentans]